MKNKMNYNNEVKNDRLLVTIQCLVYNHEPFLRQCLDGFVMQKTNFKFEAIVHDDCSTDGSVAIIKEYAERYPDIIKPILETENQWSKNDGSLNRIMNKNTRGKYVAICEGDDYWIDAYKLQKQVDFLENHDEYGLVHTNCLIADEKKNFVLEPFKRESVVNGNVYKQILQRNFISTLTVLYRASLLEYAEREIGDIKYWDRIMWICFSRHTKFYYLDELTVVYRVLRHSATHSERKYLLYKWLPGTKDLLEYLEKIDAPVEDKKLFLITRNKQLLLYSYFARDWKYAEYLWQTMYSNGQVTLSDFCLYLIICIRTPLFVYDSLKLICKIFR